MVNSLIVTSVQSWLRCLRRSPYALPLAAVINASLAVSMVLSAGGNSLTFPAASMALVAVLTLALTGSRSERAQLPFDE
jgi:hypothetical protein